MAIGSAKAADPADREQRPIRVLIVDDSQIARAVLSRMLDPHPDIEVVATAGNAERALDALRSISVDAVLLDVEMPGTSGLEALPDILSLSRGAKVLIVSSVTEDGAEATIRALALGAADTLPKPGAGTFGGRFSEILVEKVRAIGRGGSEDLPSKASSAPVEPEGAIRLRAMPEGRLGCLGLGASTGGLHALSEFLRALPAELGAPILLTQHLPPAFMPFFARQIEAASGRLTRVAEEGQALRPEQIFLAPGERHLQIVRQGASIVTRLTGERVGSGCMPSVDPMFRSMAEVYGREAFGVVFSGMGRDGLAGSGRLVESGGGVIAQDRRSCAVWGMPRAVAEAGLASAVLPPAELARVVAARNQSARR